MKTDLQEFRSLCEWLTGHRHPSAESTSQRDEGEGIHRDLPLQSPLCNFGKVACGWYWQTDERKVTRPGHFGPNTWEHFIIVFNFNCGCHESCSYRVSKIKERWSRMHIKSHLFPLNFKLRLWLIHEYRVISRLWKVSQGNKKTLSK